MRPAVGSVRRGPVGYARPVLTPTAPQDARPTFDALQRTLAARVDTTMPADGTIVVLPSLSFPPSELAKITAIERYEERLLHLLLHLADDDVRVVYVTSLPIDPQVIDYYLGFVPDPDGARRRLTLVDLGHFAGAGLAQELAADDAALRRITDAVGAAADEAVIVPFNVTAAERRVAEALGLPLFAAHPDLVHLGSKTGSRRLARDAGVPVLPGAEDLWSPDAISAAVDHLRRSHDIDAVVVKLNNGFSGQGNAMVSWAGPASGLTERSTVFCAPDETWQSFVGKIAAEGAIVERHVSGLSASPSAQAWISPAGVVEIVSTHDQVLGGPGGQVYLGCRYPAASRYRSEVIDATRRVGRELAAAGVVGPFAIDYGIVDGRAMLSEINLRLGGTTHPFGMAKAVTGAETSADSALRTPAGTRVYVATDNLTEPGLVGVRPADVITIVRDAGLAYDAERATGITLHLLGAVQEYGKLGAVCIAEDHDTAEALLHRLRDALRAR